MPVARSHELQVKATDLAFCVASVHAERRREAITHFIETLWPTTAGAKSQEESTHA